jgi:hypothetical protein
LPVGRRTVFAIGIKASGIRPPHRKPLNIELPYDFNLLTFFRRYLPPKGTRTLPKQGTADSGPETSGTLLLVFLQTLITMARLLFSLDGDPPEP